MKPSGNYVLLDLEPATWYNLRVTAHNKAGFKDAVYEFATLTLDGGKGSPSRLYRVMVHFNLSAGISNSRSRRLNKKKSRDQSCIFWWGKFDSDLEIDLKIIVDVV